MSGPAPLAVRRGWAALTLAALAFGVVGAQHFVGAESLGLRGGAVAPIGHDDYPLQFYYGQLGARFLSERLATYGYDPSFMAGYAKMPLYYPSSKPFELSLWLFSGADAATVFNRTAFAMIALLPLLAWLAAAAFALPPSERVTVAALACVPHLLVPIAGFYPILEAAGMLAFVFTSSLALLVVGLFERLARGGGAGTCAALLLCAPLLFACHPLAGLLVALPIAVVYATRFRALSGQRQLALWAVAAAVLAANALWLRGLWLYGHYATLGDFYTEGGRDHFSPPGGLWAPLRVAVPAPAALSLALPALAAAGLGCWWREGRRDRLQLFGPWIALLFALAFYGAPLGLSALGPARLTLPLGLVLFFPAAHGLRMALLSAWRGAGRLQPAARSAALRAAGALALAATLLGLGSRASLLRPYRVETLQQQSGYARHARPLLEFLRARTHPGARLLHEETDRLAHRYWGSHLPALFPLEAGVPLAGGPAPHALVRQNHLRFISGTFRGRALGAVPTQAMARHLELYNVGWVLCWSPPAKRYFDAFPGATLLGDYEKFRLYALEGTPSWFLEGRGELEVRDGRLHLRNLVPEAGRVSLKFHWLEGLRSDPPRRLEPVLRLQDPVPFLTIHDPPASLVIYDAS